MDGRPDNPTVGLPVVSPANMLPVKVAGRVERAPGVVSVFIVLPGTGQAPAPYRPGQFVTLALPTPRETLYRSYSLCGDGDPSAPWELTIKRMEMGAVSTYFYQSVVEGTLLYASLPRGTFTLPARVEPEMVFVFCAAGSGITPLMGMIRALARRPAHQRPLVHLHYASRGVEDIIFGEELEEVDPDGEWLQQWHYLSSRGDRMTAEAIVGRAGQLAGRAEWYVCGPDALKRDLVAALEDRRVSLGRFHAEVFAGAPGPGPAYRVAESEADAGGGSLYVEETGATLDVRPDETLLVALERHGYRPSFSCRAGACGECKLRVLAGQVSPIGEALSAPDRREGYVLSCLARPMGDVTLASGGRPPAGVVRIASVAAGSASRRSPVAVAGIRFASVVGVGALLLGSWQLTNHRPDSWNQPPAQSGSVGATTPAPGATEPGTAGTATPATDNTGQVTPATTAGPSATQAPGGAGTPPPAQPTATPKPPKPAPTATATPSPKH